MLAASSDEARPGAQGSSARGGCGATPSRRAALLAILAAASAIQAGTPASAERGQEGASALRSTEWAGGLRYDKILGRGSYKTVFEVSSEGGVRGALAVERLADGSNAQDALRGVMVAEYLHRVLPEEEGRLFERVDGWWVQKASPNDFAKGELVLDPDTLGDRRRSVPGRFLGSQWLLALKPAYAMDLKTFSRRAPLQVGGVRRQGVESVGRMKLDEAAALSLVRDMCNAGAAMHRLGLVHRDIKPKNIMFSMEGRPVLIDFGFTQASEKGVCIPQVRGEVKYVLAEDVVKLRGCQRGDCYAMGKSLFEIIYAEGSKGDTDESEKEYINVAAARRYNDEFRAQIAAQDAAGLSRFAMSPEVSEAILGVLRGLVDKDAPLTFGQAASMLQAPSEAAQSPEKQLGADQFR